jgi:hypothetical protein
MHGASQVNSVCETVAGGEEGGYKWMQYRRKLCNFARTFFTILNIQQEILGVNCNHTKEECSGLTL